MMTPKIDFGDVRLMLAILGFALLVLTWFTLIQWAGRAAG